MIANCPKINLKITKICKCFRLVEQIRKIKRVSPTNPTKEEEHHVIKASATQKVVEKPQEMGTQRKKPNVVTTKLEPDTNEKPTGSTNMTECESCLYVYINARK